MCLSNTFTLILATIVMTPIAVVGIIIVYITQTQIMTRFVKKRNIRNRLNSNKGTKRDMAISLIPFDRLDFWTLDYPQNGVPI